MASKSSERINQWHCECGFPNIYQEKKSFSCEKKKPIHVGSFNDWEPSLPEWICVRCDYVNRVGNSCCFCKAPNLVTEEPGLRPTGFSASVSQATGRLTGENKCEQRLVLIGRTGSGKSSTGNSILGDAVFESKTSMVSVTKGCRRVSRSRFRRKTDVIDTPGLFDTGMSNDDVTKEVIKCVGMSAPGPHAFVMIIRIGRFTKEESETMNHFIKVFGEGMLDYMIIVFTRKDELFTDGRSFQQYLKELPDELKWLLQSCNNRCVAFNNRMRSDKDVQDLLQLIDRIFIQNAGTHYTNDMFTEAEIAVAERVRELEKQCNTRIPRETEVLAEELQMLQEDEKRRRIEEDLQQQEEYMQLLDSLEVDFREEARKEIEKENEEMMQKLKKGFIKAVSVVVKIIVGVAASF